MIDRQAFIYPIAAHIDECGSRKRDKVARAENIFVFSCKKQHGKRAHTYGRRQPERVSADDIRKPRADSGSAYGIRCGKHDSGEKDEAVARVDISGARRQGYFDEMYRRR